MINISKNVKKPSQILNVYKICRSDDYGYDEAIELAIVAESKEQALEIANKNYYGEWEITKKVDLTQPQVIMVESLDG